MFGKKVISDKELSNTVHSRLARTGTGSRVTARISRGVVTLSGNLQHAGQRNPIMAAASKVEGVRQVIDQMVMPAKKKMEAPIYVPKPMAAPVEQVQDPAVADDGEARIDEVAAEVSQPAVQSNEQVGG